MTTNDTDPDAKPPRQKTDPNLGRAVSDRAHPAEFRDRGAKSHRGPTGRGLFGKTAKQRREDLPDAEHASADADSDAGPESASDSARDDDETSPERPSHGALAERAAKDADSDAPARSRNESIDELLEGLPLNAPAQKKGRAPGTPADRQHALHDAPKRTTDRIDDRLPRTLVKTDMGPTIPRADAVRRKRRAETAVTPDGERLQKRRQMGRAMMILGALSGLALLFRAYVIKPGDTPDVEPPAAKTSPASNNSPLVPKDPEPGPVLGAQTQSLQPASTPTSQSKSHRRRHHASMHRTSGAGAKPAASTPSTAGGHTAPDFDEFKKEIQR